MIYDLDGAKQRVKNLEELRLTRALTDTSNEFQHVLQLISMLLHVNHASLPGYIINSPAGIDNFEFSDYQKQYVSLLDPEFNFTTYSSSIKTSTNKSNTNNALPAIHGVYAMGSIASISQTSSSDLDIWVCHREDLNTIERNKLLQKSLALQSWARKFNVDVNLYLMDQQRFRHFHHADALTTENCGSAQYMLLLEEFYRSAIRLAGKPLLWLHLWVKDEKKYDKEVKRLVEKGDIDLSDWVDFGGLGDLSANEYFGASLWHLYKGIDSPFKAVLKILLLEVYSWQYPKTELIAQQFKQDLLNKKDPKHQFDTYLAMLENVTNYLKYIRDDFRLDFVRYCFYIKANEDRIKIQNSWRLQLLDKVSESWSWDKNKFNEINQRSQWKIKSVKNIYNKLVRILMLSYRNLVNFARQHNVNASIIPQDIGILTRKLYTAFEELPGKVTLLNRQIAKNLSESNLTFIEVKTPKGIKKQGWYVVNQAPKIMEFSNMRYVEYNPNLNKLVAWAYFNGLLTETTNLYISSSNVSIEKLCQFVDDLRRSFPITVPPATNEELHHPCEIRSLVVAVNLVLDPTKQLTQPHNNEIQTSDLFNFGTNEESLVGSIDLIYRNLWNEIRTLHFEGSNAILLALKVLSNKIHRGSTSPEAVNVFCYSKYYQQPLQYFVNLLVHKCINIQVGASFHKQTIDTLRVAGRNWQFFFEESGVNLLEIPNNKNNIIENNIKTSNTETKKQTIKDLNYPHEIDAFASEGFLQFFFEDNINKTFNVYILDEQNRLEVYKNCDGYKENKIQEINKIYNSSNKKGYKNPYNIIQRDFNYPQFYQLLYEYKKVKIVPFHSKYNSKSF